MYLELVAVLSFESGLELLHLDLQVLVLLAQFSPELVHLFLVLDGHVLELGPVLLLLLSHRSVSLLSHQVQFLA